MKKFLLLGVGGAVSFVGTVVGLLAAQGRLNHDGVQGIPLLSSFFPAPQKPKDVHGDTDAHGNPVAGKPDAEPGHGTADAHPPANAAEAGRSAGLGMEKPLPYRQGSSLFKEEPAAGGGHGAPKDTGHGGPTEPEQDDHGAATAEHGTGDVGADAAKSTAPRKPETTSEWKAKVDSVLGQGQYRPGRLWTFPQIEAGIGVDELNEILRRAREERSSVERDRAALQQQRSELLARERDVADRQDAVLEKLREVEQLRAKLQAEIDEFHNTVLLIRQDEVSGLQAVAKTLGAVESKSAAQVIKKWWETDEGQSRALKIWTVMDNDAANAILAELDVEMIRQVLEKRLKVVREQAKAKK